MSRLFTVFLSRSPVGVCSFHSISSSKAGQNWKLTDQVNIRAMDKRQNQMRSCRVPIFPALSPAIWSVIFHCPDKPSVRVLHGYEISYPCSYPFLPVFADIIPTPHFSRRAPSSSHPPLPAGPHLPVHPTMPSVELHPHPIPRTLLHTRSRI